LSRRLRLLLDESIGIGMYEELEGRGFDLQSMVLELEDAKNTRCLKSLNSSCCIV